MTNDQATTAELATPRWSPSTAELDDLEVLLLGGFGTPPLVGDSEARLQVPEATAQEAAVHGGLVVLDEEGAPYAEVTVTVTRALSSGQYAVDGEAQALAPPARGSHRSLRTSADEARRACDGPVLGLPVDRPLHAPQIVQLRTSAASLGARVLLLPLTGEGSPRGIDGPSLVRACLSVRHLLGADLVDVVPVALPRRGTPDEDRARAVRVAGAYGATHVLDDRAGVGDGAAPCPLPVPRPEVALDLRTGMWSPAEEVPLEHRSADRAEDVEQHVRSLLFEGRPVPSGLTDVAVVRELSRRVRPHGCGFAVLFTGLSGSGKSTIARAVDETLTDRTDRTVTLLDGDIVRRMLSSELGFSRRDRELNVRRIGYVAAEIAKHGGIALCTPIAPYTAMRQEFRSTVERHAAGFLLVHVATSLELCEARDRKGLYARARAGSLPEFTGISDPYEEPENADLVIDTARVPVADAVSLVLDACAARGWLRLLPGDDR